MGGQECEEDCGGFCCCWGYGGEDHRCIIYGNILGQSIAGNGVLFLVSGSFCGLCICILGFVVIDICRSTHFLFFPPILKANIPWDFRISLRR